VKQVSGKEFARIIQKHGWMFKRINGSHHVFVKQGLKERVVIPVHGNLPLKIGLLKRQMKIAGVMESDL